VKLFGQREEQIDRDALCQKSCRVGTIDIDRGDSCT